VSVVACSNQELNGKKRRIKEAKERLKREILRDARADMLSLEKVTTNPDDFTKALAGKTLDDFTREFNNDLNAGKIKIRKYENIKLSFIDISKEFLARVKVVFTDSSYYVSKNNPNLSLTFPQSEEKKFMLHLLKTDNRWKIVAVAEL
jgi:hypothetical protein